MLTGAWWCRVQHAMWARHLARPPPPSRLDNLVIDRLMRYACPCSSQSPLPQLPSGSQHSGAAILGLMESGCRAKLLGHEEDGPGAAAIIEDLSDTGEQNPGSFRQTWREPSSRSFVAFAPAFLFRSNSPWSHDGRCLRAHAVHR